MIEYAICKNKYRNNMKTIGIFSPYKSNLKMMLLQRYLKEYQQNRSTLNTKQSKKLSNSIDNKNLH